METPRKLLETPESRLRYNVARKGERDSLKSGRIWAISSQAYSVALDEVCFSS